MMPDMNLDLEIYGLSVVGSYGDVFLRLQGPLVFIERLRKMPGVISFFVPRKHEVQGSCLRCLR